VATAVAVVGTSGSALALINATSAATAATVTSAGSNSLTVGASNQALANLTLSFPANGTAEEYNAGEVITFTLGSTATHPVNDLSLSSFNTASFAAAPTVTVDNGVTAPGATVALASSGSGTNNAFTVTFNAAAPENTGTTDFTISGLKVNLGSTVSPGQTVNVVAKATTPAAATPFWTGAASNTETVAVGTISQLALAASKVVVAAPSTTSVTLGTITITDVVGGTLQANDVLHLTLNAGTWTTAPTATGSPALASAPAGIGTATLAFTVGTTAAAAGNVLTLTGGVVTLPATAGPVIATLTDTSAGHAFGINPTVQVASALTQARIGGSDRYATGTLLYNPTFGPTATHPATTVVLTSGANYPDALSAQYLAKQLSTATVPVGILTTDPNALPASTQQQLLQHSGTFLGIDTVYIVGGTAAVSQNVQNAVAALHVGGNSGNSTINVVRISGADRYATNAAVDLYSGVTSPGVAYVAVGTNFADALAIGPVVYKTGAPLVLTDGGSLTPSAASTLQNLGVSSVIIVGGTSAVSTAVETAITALGITVKYRFAGADRTGTASEVATYETSASTSALPASGSYAALAGLGSFTVGTVYLARGDNFADALVAGPVAGAAAHPILLTANPTTLGAGAPGFLGGTAAGAVTTVTALGLTSAVSAATLNAAAGSVS